MLKRESSRHINNIRSIERIHSIGDTVSVGSHGGTVFISSAFNNTPDDLLSRSFYLVSPAQRNIIEGIEAIE